MAHSWIPSWAKPRIHTWRPSQGLKMWPRICPSSHTPLSSCSITKLVSGEASSLAYRGPPSLCPYMTFSLCIGALWCLLPFLKEHSHATRTRAPSLWAHLTLITSLKVYLQTWSHGSLELQSMKLRQGVATIQSITDISYVSVSVPLTVAVIAFFEWSKYLHRVEKIFLNA